MVFHCTKCGQCCRNVGKVPLLKEYDKGDGTCIYLINNLCGIYDSRPLLCNVERAYDEIFRFYMTEQEYISLNTQMCEELLFLFLPADEFPREL